MLTSEGLAYLAGIVDGEGSISLVRARQHSAPVTCRNSRSKNRPEPGVNLRLVVTVAVGMTEGVIPDWLYQEFGGQLHYRVNSNPKWKDRWDWIISSQLACTFLRSIYPYLIVKKEQARLVIQFQEARIPGLPLSGERRLLDEAIYNEMRGLNRRGKVVKEVVV